MSTATPLEYASRYKALTVAFDDGPAVRGVDRKGQKRPGGWPY